LNILFSGVHILTKRTFKVLVCDKDSDALITLQHALENAGFDTTITWEEAEIHKFIEDVSFDVILVGDYPPRFTVQTIQDNVESRSVSRSCLVLATTDGKAEYFLQLGSTEVVSTRSFGDNLSKFTD
jgi:CheY-like chemotaxis protein